MFSMDTRCRILQTTICDVDNQNKIYYSSVLNLDQWKYLPREISINISESLNIYRYHSKYYFYLTYVN